MAVWMLFGTVFGYAACIQSTSQSYSSSSANATGTGSTGTAMVAFDKRALLSSLANLALGEIDGFATQTEALLVATESLQRRRRRSTSTAHVKPFGRQRKRGSDSR